MIDPSGVDELGLPRNSLEMKPEAADDCQARVVRRRCRTTNAMYSGPMKCKLKARRGSLRHVPVATRLSGEPIPEFARAVQMHTIIERDQTEEVLVRPITDDEP